MSVNIAIMRATKLMKMLAPDFAPEFQNYSNSDVWDSIKFEIDSDGPMLTANFYGSFYDSNLEWEEREQISADRAYRRLIKVRRMIGGKWNKEFVGSYTYYDQEIDGLKVRLECSRAATCKKIVTGTKVIPAKTIPARVEPERTEEEYEWVCD